MTRQPRCEARVYPREHRRYDRPYRCTRRPTQQVQLPGSYGPPTLLQVCSQHAAMFIAKNGAVLKREVGGRVTDPSRLCPEAKS